MEYKKRNNKKIIFVLIGVICMILLVGCYFLFHQEKDNNNIDTSLIGEDIYDPENNDLIVNQGQEIIANQLMTSNGKSNGIDVSKWQGKIDWEKVSKDHIDFAFIRIGYRGENGTIYKDENADYNIQQAQKKNILVGVYFFSTAVNKTEAKEESNWVLKAIEGYQISYPVVYDCEGFDVQNSRMSSLSVDQRSENANVFLDAIKKEGYDTMFYSSLSHVYDSWNLSEIEKNHKIWIAQYSSTIYPQKEKPDYEKICHAWQYTNKGTVNGINGNVDMVVCYFVNQEAKAKNQKVKIKQATAPLTSEEKQYDKVNEKVTAKDIVNLRKSATTKSDIVSSLKNGETLTRIGIGSNGWSKLNYKGQTVYAISSYLTTDLKKKTDTTKKEDIVEGHVFTLKKDKVTAKEIANLRSLPTTNSELIGELKSGDFIERVAISQKG